MDFSKESPAFPVPMPGTGEYCSGMTLRDWFAGQALAGLMVPPLSLSGDPDSVATLAYQLADGMLEARKGG